MKSIWNMLYNITAITTHIFAKSTSQRRFFMLEATWGVNEYLCRFTAQDESEIKLNYDHVVEGTI